jgi:hypothetical protein
MVPLKGRSNTTGMLKKDFEEATNFLKTSQNRNATKAEVSLSSVGSLFHLKWKLRMRIRLSKTLRDLFSKIHQKFKSFAAKVKSTWKKLEERIKNGRDKYQKVKGEANQTLEARSFEDDSEKLTRQLKDSQRKSPAILYLFQGGQLPNLFDSEPHDVELDFETSEDYVKTLNIEIPSHQFTNTHSTIQKIPLNLEVDFRDHLAVENAFNDLVSKAEHHWKTSLFNNTEDS